MTVNQTIHLDTKVLAQGTGWTVKLTNYRKYQVRVFIAVKLIKLAGWFMNLGKIEITSEMIEEKV